MNDKTLIIYDLNGSIIGNPITGFYKVPNGIPYIEVVIPKDKCVIGVNVETKEPIFSDLPLSETELLSKKFDILNAQSANLLLDNAKKEIEISTLNTNLANITLEVAKIKGGM